MKFKIIICFSFLFLCFERADAKSILWEQILGYRYNEIGRDVIELRDKGYLMVGEQQVLKHGNSFLAIQTYVVKLNQEGVIIWQKTFGDSINTNFSLSAVEDEYGNIYIPYTTYTGARLLKINSLGEIYWDISYSSSNVKYFTAISFVENYRKLVILGYNDINSLITSSITKVDSSGNIIWTKPYYDSIPNYSAYSSYSNCHLFTDSFYLISGNKGENGFVLKTDTSGNRLWTHRFTDSRYILSIEKNSENTFIATGAGRNYGTYCVKFNQFGDTLWSRNYGSDTTYNFGYNKIVKTYNGNFALGTLLFTDRMRLGIIDSLGNILSVFRKSFGQDIVTSQENFTITSDSGFVFTGYYYKYPSAGNYPYDAIIFKLDKEGKIVSVSNTIYYDSDFNFNVYPNPFNLSFKLNFNIHSYSKVLIELFNISGKKIKTIVHNSQLIGEHIYIVNTNDISSGIYFIRSQINNKIYTKKIILLR